MKIQLHPKPENPNAYRHPESSWVELRYALPFFVYNNKPVAHRVRSGQIYYRSGEYLHAAYGFYCEGSGFDKGGILQDNLAPGVAMCWACEAKAVAFGCPPSAELVGRPVTLTVRKQRNKKPMSKTAVIMSEAEAMALPQSKRPLCFRVPSKIYHDVFEAIGAASLCWKPRPTNEVFATEEASNVAVDLCFKIAAELERLGVTTEMMRGTTNVVTPANEAHLITNAELPQSRRAMPLYQSHKKVWALKIEAVLRDNQIAAVGGRETDGSATLVPSDTAYAPFKVDAAYVAKHNPEAKGYYVVYEDGYKSFSPAEAFESGYTRIVSCSVVDPEPIGYAAKPEPTPYINGQAPSV